MGTLWRALVVLAAVFAVHGLQCASHDSHPDPGQGALVTAVSLSVPAAGGMAHAIDAMDAQTLSGAGGGSDHVEPLSRLAETASLPDAPLGNVVAVCLAVLSAALALVVALVIRPGPTSYLHPAPPNAQRWIARRVPLRPPDLFSLCILRT